MYPLKNTFWMFCLVLIHALAGYAQSSPPLGMVLQSTGEVYLQRGRDKRAVKLADLVYTGDQIIAQSGETAFLFCPSSERVNLKTGSSVQLAADSLKVLKGTPPVKQKVGRCALPQVALGSESLERVGALRGRGYPPIPLYVGGAITMARPKFQWGSVAEAQSYQVTLKSDLGVSLWQHRTTDLTAAYPESKAALEPKLYQWEVRADKDGKIIALQTANLEIKPNAELSQRSAEDAASKLLLATELEIAGYYAEAAAYFRQLRQQSPDDVRLTRHLAWLYWNAGLITASNEERERLTAVQEK